MKNEEKSTDALLDGHRNLQLIQPPIGGYTPRLNFRVDVKGVTIEDFGFFCQNTINYFSFFYIYYRHELST